MSQPCLSLLPLHLYSGYSSLATKSLSPSVLSPTSFFFLNLLREEFLTPYFFRKVFFDKTYVKKKKSLSGMIFFGLAQEISCKCKIKVIFTRLMNVCRFHNNTVPQDEHKMFLSLEIRQWYLMSSSTFTSYLFMWQILHITWDCILPVTLSCYMTVTHLKSVLPKSTKNRKYTYKHTNILHKLPRNSREYGFMSRHPIYLWGKGKGSNNDFHEQNDLNKSSF